MSKAHSSKAQGKKKTRSSTSSSKGKGKSISKGVRINDRKELDHLNALGNVAELQQAFSKEKKTKKMRAEVGTFLSARFGRKSC
jgi:hypothetical protein